MEALTLQGDTLGKRHEHYNKLTKKAISNFDTLTSGLPKINYEENDIDNLLRIDVACANREVEYILEVLKSEDLLYVSRALRRCTWLVTERQYAHIVSPEHLHEHLFPQMSAKASRKLLLHVRLHLRDEARIEQFYGYFRDRDLQTALKWLPHCSLPFIENIVKMNAVDIKMPLLKRLCQRFPAILKSFIETLKDKGSYTGQALQANIFLLNRNAEEYLDIVESSNYFPNFGKKHTALIMKKCPQRITNNFEKYACYIDIQIFARNLKKEDLKEFLLKRLTHKDLQHWVTFKILQFFIELMPDNERFPFVKKVFIDKKGNDKTDSDTNNLYSVVKETGTSVYYWYSFAPFDIAFTELKKLIAFESSPNERAKIWSILLSTAGNNLQQIQTLLQYYRDNHINEPLKFKSKFLSQVLTQTHTHKYDRKVWNILNEIFFSMDVYTDSDNNSTIQTCIQSIIIFRVIHNEKIPDIIEKKFEFNTLSSYQKQMNCDEKCLVFDYLHKFIKTKVINKAMKNEIEFKESIMMLEKSMDLLKDWKKELTEFLWIMDKIKEYVEIKKANSWTANLASLYNKNKSWRRAMFQESLSLYTSEATCVNALKHDASTLQRHEFEVETLRCADGISLRQVLYRLRIYWPQSLAADWTRAYRDRLTQPGGHRALVRGLCVLLPRQQLLELLRHFRPLQPRIDWSQQDELALSLQKHFAKSMHLARPHPPLDALLQYALGDYLQYALPSLNAMFYNISSIQSRELVPKMLNTPVSLQKHGLRFAFTKLQSKELTKIFREIWKSANNSSIRTVLFQLTHSLLCKEKDPSTINEIWKLLSMFIDNLSSDENKIIYNTLGKVSDVPLELKGEYCEKSYKYLKSLPAKANADLIIEKKIIDHLREIMDYLNVDFATSIMLEYINEQFSIRKNSYSSFRMHLLAAYLLCNKDKESETKKYEEVLIPLMKCAFNMWDAIHNEEYYVRHNFSELLWSIGRHFELYLLEKEMIVPVVMFARVQEHLENALSLEENYVLLRTWKLTAILMKLVLKYKTMSDFNRNWNDISHKMAEEFGNACTVCLKEDVELYCPSVYMLIANVVEQITYFFNIETSVQFKILNSILKDQTFVQSYLLAINLIPHNVHAKDLKSEWNEIRRIIYSHPSEEVKMHYCQKFGIKPISEITLI